jgi:hypothetical protein
MHGWMEVWRGLTGSKLRWMDFPGALTGALFDWLSHVGGLTGALFDWSYCGAVRPLATCGESNWGGVDRVVVRLVEPRGGLSPRGGRSALTEVPRSGRPARLYPHGGRTPRLRSGRVARARRSARA